MPVLVGGVAGAGAVVAGAAAAESESLIVGWVNGQAFAIVVDVVGVGISK